METINAKEIIILAVCDTGQVVQLEISQEAEDRIFELLEMEENMTVGEFKIDQQGRS